MDGMILGFPIVSLFPATALYRGLLLLPFTGEDTGGQRSQGRCDRAWIQGHRGSRSSCREEGCEGPSPAGGESCCVSFPGQ